MVALDIIEQNLLGFCYYKKFLLIIILILFNKIYIHLSYKRSYEKQCLKTPITPFIKKGFVTHACNFVF